MSTVNLNDQKPRHRERRSRWAEDGLYGRIELVR